MNFIEERPYVDFITDFLLFVCKDECCPPTADNPDGNDDNSDNNDMPDVLDRLAGCNDVEQLLQDQLNFIGVVVAQPSTPRSILVSVPRHIIVPYEEPVKPSRCEERAAAQVPVPGPVAGVPRIPQATEPPPERPQPTGTPAVVTTGTNAAVEKTLPATGQPTADKAATEKTTGAATAGKTGAATPAADKTAVEKAAGSTGTAAATDAGKTGAAKPATVPPAAATAAADKTAADKTTAGTAAPADKAAADKGTADTAGKPADQPAPEKTPAAPLKLTGAKKATKKTDKKNPK